MSLGETQPQVCQNSKERGDTPAYEAAGTVTGSEMPPPLCLTLIINAAHTQKEAQIRMILPSDMGFEQKFQYEFVGSLNKNLIFLTKISTSI